MIFQSPKRSEDHAMECRLDIGTEALRVEINRLVARHCRKTWTYENFAAWQTIL
jgi:hypothetical protein